MDRPGCGFLSADELGRYLDGSLTAGRNDAFRGHRQDGCADCTLLAADAQVFRGVVEGGILESERRDFERGRAIVKAELRQRLEKMDSGRSRTATVWMRWVPALGAVAALLMLAIVVAPRVPLGDGADGRIELADGSLVALTPFEYVDPLVVRGATGTAELWNEVGEAYRAGRYEDAVAPLTTLAERAPDAVDTHLYLGNALLMSERFEQARDALERAETLAGRGSAATFGLAQVHLALGDVASSTAALESVIERGGPMTEAARELLGTISD